jgi:uncharacterized delta-60 repeat protein
MTINKWTFFWGLAVYFVLSSLVFLQLTTAFIATIFVYFILIPFSTITLLIILIINIIYKKTNIRPNIAFILVWFVILFQIVFALTLYSSCNDFGSLSDLSGGYFVHEVVFGNNGPEYCGTGLSNSYASGALVFYMVLGYIITLLLTIIRAYYLAFKNRNKDELNNKIPTTKVLIGITSLIIVISLILYSLYSKSNIENNTDQQLRPETFNLQGKIRSDYFKSGDYNSVVMQKDGKFIVGGNFTTYLGKVANRIIRLNTDGSIDTSFDIGTGFDNAVQTVLIQDDGKILIGGTFSTYQGSVANRVIRLNTDGSIDTSFNVGNGFNHKYAYINTIAIQEDGKIIVAGNFGKYKGVSTNRILRFNNDGSRDKTFISKAGFNSPIYNITIQDDGKILVAGGFERIGKDKVVRLNNNGSLDNSFKVDLGNVKFITEQSDGKIILIGDFDTYKGVSANRIIRLNSDGSIDKSFIPQMPSNYRAKNVSIKPDGKILVGGESRDFIDNRVTTKGVIRLNNDGSKDETFSKRLIQSPYNGFEENIRSIAVQSDGKIVVVGDFYNYQGSIEDDVPKGVARLNSDGTWDNDFITIRSSPPPLDTRP